jgi:nitrite reductase (NADH) small subunit
MTTLVERLVWTDICAYGDLLPERGVCALVRGAQVAVFRLHDGTLRAVGNYDPAGGAYVLSRGIVGSRGDTPTVASPLYKHVYDLTTGTCLDDGTYVVPVVHVRVTDGRVELGTARSAMSQ